MQSLLGTSYEGRGTSAMRHYKLTHWHIKTLCLCVSAFYQSFLTFNSNFMENPQKKRLEQSAPHSDNHSDGHRHQPWRAELYVIAVGADRCVCTPTVDEKESVPSDPTAMMPNLCTKISLGGG